MPWTEVYFLKRSTLPAFSCSSRVSTLPGPSRWISPPTMACRFRGDRDGATVSSALSCEGLEVEPAFGYWPAPGSADEIPAVDDEDMAVDIVRSWAGQEDDGPH